MATFSARPTVCVTSRKTVICPAQKDHAAAPNKQAAVAVALTVSIAVGPVAAPPTAQAQSYSERLAAMQQRKQLLADARENAVNEGQSAPTGYDYLESMKNALSMKVPELPPNAEVLAEEPGPAPEPEAPAPSPAPAFKGFSFSKPAAEAPAQPPASESSAPEPAEAPAPAYKGFSWSRPAPPAPKPEQSKPAEDAPEEAPAVKPFSFSRPTPAPEPAPAPTPAPAPAPAPKPFSFSAPKPAEPEAPKVETPKPAPPKVEAKKVEEPKVDEKSKKRKGPLPMALAQILLLGAYGGAAYLFLVKSDEVGKAAEGLSQSAAGVLKQLSPAKEESAASK